ncbi:MarR family transcriptional regulator [Ruminococcaceae bacterium OttesenSCG-928-D13]|nr:MarR family transcriptional regulator [Ruminococcaceae bacterium OttesenSCG-928-D13]
MIFKREWARREHARAAALLNELERMRRLWHGVRPPPPLKRSDLALLGMLDHVEREHGQPMTASQMAAKMHQSLPAISQKLRALEGVGMISRKTDKGDRRVAYVALTSKGREAARQSLDEMIGRLEQTMDKLGADETRQLLELLARLNDLMEEDMNPNVEREEVESGC